MSNNRKNFSPAIMRKGNQTPRIQSRPAEVAKVDVVDQVQNAPEAESKKPAQPESPPVATAPKAAETPRPKTVASAPRHSAAAAASIPLSAPAVQTSACLAEFKSLLSAPKVSRAQAAKSMDYLKKATSLVIQNPTPDVLNVMWNFYKTNKDGVCQEKVALLGAKSLTPADYMTVSVLYNAFRARTVAEILPMRDNELLAVIPNQRILQFLKTAR